MRRTIRPWPARARQHQGLRRRRMMRIRRSSPPPTGRERDRPPTEVGDDRRTAGPGVSGDGDCITIGNVIGSGVRRLKQQRQPRGAGGS